MEGQERHCAEECVAAGSVYGGMRDEGGRERGTVESTNRSGEARSAPDAGTRERAEREGTSRDSEEGSVEGMASTRAD
jgi:hypothetical protein